MNAKQRRNKNDPIPTILKALHQRADAGLCCIEKTTGWASGSKKPKAMRMTKTLPLLQ